MATKDSTKTQGSSGGAAAAAGVGFQERVAALAMAHILVGSDDLAALSLSGSFKLLSIHLETALAIDDVVLVGDQFRVLIQAKRTVSLSESTTSDFSTALAQFVKHHQNGSRAGDRYALATTLRSSDRVIYDLRKLTEAVRLNSQSLETDPLTEAEREVLRKTRRLISHHLGLTNDGVVTEAKVDEILRCIWILPLDVESGGRDEALAFALLKSRSIVDPALIWNALLELSSTLARRRGSVDQAGIHERLGHLVKPAGEKKVVEDDFRQEVQLMKSVATGMEVLILDQFQGMEGITVAAFYRFAKDGRQRLVFKKDMCIFPNGSAHKVLFRSATVEGTNRYFETNRSAMTSRKVTLVPYSGKDDPNESSWAKAHRDLLDRHLKRNGHLLQCLVCGDPVSENKALIAELDEDGADLSAGYVHLRCHRPSLRVLGEIQSDQFVKFAFLKDFDYESWILANKSGASSISQNLFSEGVHVVAWNAVGTSTKRGNWCIRIDLQDGGACYVHERTKVVRLGQVEAQEHAVELTSSFKVATDARNPWCYTSDRSLFGNYSLIASRLKPGQRLLKCIKAEAVPFSAAIDVAYSSKGNHYAPIVVLIELETGRPINIRNTVPLITNPFDLPTYLSNWSEAGFAVQPYAVSILANDQEFDSLVRSCLERTQQVVIDPLLDLKGTPLRGLVVRPLEDLIAKK